MTSPSPVEVLTQARARVVAGETIIDALAGAAPYGVNRNPAARLIKDAFYGMGASDIMTVVDWNDAPGRTQEEVLALMDRALDLARQKEAGGDVL